MILLIKVVLSHVTLLWELAEGLITTHKSQVLKADAILLMCQDLRSYEGLPHIRFSLIGTTSTASTGIEVTPLCGLPVSEIKGKWHERQ